MNLRSQSTMVTNEKPDKVTGWRSSKWTTTIRQEKSMWRQGNEVEEDAVETHEVLCIIILP